MFPMKGLRIALIAVSIAFGPGAIAHADIYNWPGYGGGGLAEFNYDMNGNWIWTNVPAPTSINLLMLYDGLNASSSSSTTSGDTTSYNYPDVFFYSYATGQGSSQWPDFQGLQAQTVTVIAPPPGGGLDEIQFGVLAVDDVGVINIFAPNGTLSTSTQLPVTLTAFEDYGLHDAYAGWFAFSIINSGGPPYYDGVAFGILGTVPEPSSLVLLATSGAFVSSLVVFRKWKLTRQRNGCRVHERRLWRRPGLYSRRGFWPDGGGGRCGSD